VQPITMIKNLTRDPGIELAEAVGLLAVLNVTRAVYSGIRGALATDFATYYADARGGLRHGWARLYDVALQHQAWRDVGVQVPFAPNPNTPFLQWLVAPLVSLPFCFAYVVWFACLICALAIAWHLTAPGSGLFRIVYLALGFSLIPVMYGLGMGQADALVAAAVAGSWWLLARRHDLAAGLLLTVVILKPQLAFMVPPVLLAAGRWRAVTGWLFGVAGSVSVAVLVIGVPSLGLYLNRLSATAYGTGDYEVVSTHTIFGVLGHGIMAWAVVGLIAGSTLVVGWRWRKSGMTVPIAAALVASLLITPYVHNYDITMLLPAAWLYLRTEPPAWHRGLLFAAYLAANSTIGTAVPIVEGLWLTAIIARVPAKENVADEKTVTTPQIAVASARAAASDADSRRVPVLPALD
jgi:Glycosyltransferase family 87